MANSIVIDPAAIRSSVKKLKELLKNYQDTCKKLRDLTAGLELDSTQMAAVTQSVDDYEAQFKNIQNYLENGVIEVLETAAKTYDDADIT